jgi:nucleotide-binding universal stress UspA family protein
VFRAFRRRPLRLPAADERPCILLATEGRPIPKVAVAEAAELALAAHARVHVLAIARIHGVGFGLPAPGLFPNKQEWQERRDTVAAAIEALKRRGLEADGHVFGTRKATKRIVGEAERLGCQAIVMAGDRPRNRFIGDFSWSQEPYRVQRRAKIPVHVVVGGD